MHLIFATASQRSGGCFHLQCSHKLYKTKQEGNKTMQKLSSCISVLVHITTTGCHSSTAGFWPRCCSLSGFHTGLTRNDSHHTQSDTVNYKRERRWENSLTWVRRWSCLSCSSCCFSCSSACNKQTHVTLMKKEAWGLSYFSLFL